MPKQGKKTKFDEEVNHLANLLRSEHGDVMMRSSPDSLSSGSVIALSLFRTTPSDSKHLTSLWRFFAASTRAGVVLLLPPPDKMLMSMFPYHPIFSPNYVPSCAFQATSAP
ncbi:hypothetical protein PR003_g7189 [Phytophthora rubi]|uniref:Uncharacterized protein n=1 Tax=Phytophthora rubi TaxID=129364 RepID=A0A6A3NLC0_9STRA|nr:hypothetical protein PR002_g7065 [Phytophthora rubi]KAE9041219.1 hypothetical protein PR001_g6709 [Phytophthora rubi]KAE9346934.1 hypothetical protein PR003_g7189 [Phytophthora rubi]